MFIRRIIAYGWRHSWLLTAPFAAAILAWLLPVWRDFRQFNVFHPASMHRSSDIDLNLRQIALSRLASLRADLLSSWRSRWETITPALPVIDLYVSTAALAELNDYLPKSGKGTWVSAKARFPDGGLNKASVRYRGDSLHHWGLAAKSWLIRTSKTELIDGSQRWHVVLPRWRAVSNYYVNLRMADKMGIFAPDPKLVSLRVNGRQHGGVHLLLPPEDENFLHNHGRPPGDFYSGDMSTMDDVYAQERPIAGLWELPWLWQKAAADNRFEADSHLPLEILFQRIYHGTPEALSEILDMPAWAKFAAYMQLFDASHMDMGHNWKLYYNPGKLTFEPVVGDGNGMPDNINEVSKGVPGLDLSVTTPLLARLHQDHDFLRLKNEALARFFAAKLDANYLEELDGFVAKVAPTLDVYPQIDWMGTVDGAPIHYFSGSELRQRAERVKPELRRWFDSQRQLATLQVANVGVSRLSDHMVRLQIRGYAGAKISLPASSSAPSVRLTVYDENGRPQSADVSSRLEPSPDGRWLINLTLLAARQITFPTEGTHSGRHEIMPATYDLTVSDRKVTPDDLELVGLLGERIRPVPASVISPVRFASSNSHVIPRAQGSSDWNGTMQIEGILVINGDLTIAPGTKLRMAPGASLVVRGRLQAIGTNREPIVVERRDPSAPWGTLAVVGPNADGTTLRFCQISGGSVHSAPFEIFSGMFAVYNTRRVTVEDCRFGNNTSSQDLFFAACSELAVRRSKFIDANHNAITFAYCRGQLEQVLVDRAGGSALQLTASDASLISCRFRNAANKGLAARRGTQVTVFNCEFTRNNFGVAAEDGSGIVLYNSLLSENRTQLEGHQRNRAFTVPANLVVAKSSVTSGGRIYSLTDNATVTLQDSQAPEHPPLSRLNRDLLSDPTATAKSTLPASCYGRLPADNRWAPARHGVRGLADPAALPPITNGPS